jgi:peroxiredoxin (alkyl hydroperoxide reductase subunit C)
VSVSAYIDLALIENEFKVLNCELIGLSGGGIHSHIALLKTIREEIEFKEMKNAGINFPLIEGASMDLSKELRVIQAEHGKTSAIGVVFFIDPDAIIRAIVHYPVYIGFNTEELKRVIIALQTADNFDTSAPSNWVSGNSTQWPIDGSYESVNVNLESKDKELIGCDCFFCTSVLIE